MKYISEKHINLGIAFVILFVATLIGGVFKLSLIIFSSIFLFSYIILDKKKLRCPSCGGFESLDRLINSKNHVNFCIHCGEQINISK